MIAEPSSEPVIMIIQLLTSATAAAGRGGGDAVTHTTSRHEMASPCGALSCLTATPSPAGSKQESVEKKPVHTSPRVVAATQERPSVLRTDACPRANCPPSTQGLRICRTSQSCTRQHASSSASSRVASASNGVCVEVLLSSCTVDARGTRDLSLVSMIEHPLRTSHMEQLPLLLSAAHMLPSLVTCT